MTHVDFILNYPSSNDRQLIQGLVLIPVSEEKWIVCERRRGRMSVGNNVYFFEDKESEGVKGPSHLQALCLVLRD